MFTNVNLLGTVSVTHGDQQAELSGAELAVVEPALGFLLERQGEDVSVDELHDRLYDVGTHTTRESGLAATRRAKAQLIEILDGVSWSGITLTTSRRGFVRLDTSHPCTTDLESLTDSLRTETRPKELAATLLRASQPLMPGAHGPWVDAKRSELQALRFRALLRLSDAERHDGDLAAALSHALAALSLEPQSDEACRAMLRCHLDAGNPSLGADVYDRFAAGLRARGRRPAPETEAMHLTCLGAEGRRAMALIELVDVAAPGEVHGLWVRFEELVRDVAALYPDADVGTVGRRIRLTTDSVGAAANLVDIALRALARRHPDEAARAAIVGLADEDDTDLSTGAALQQLQALLVGVPPGELIVDDSGLDVPGIGERSDRADHQHMRAVADRTMAVLDALAALLQETHLVGRDVELEQLGGFLDDVRGGASRCVLIDGEAGIGKTRLVLELGRMAHERGLLVLYGRAPEGSNAFDPVTEALTPWIEEAPQEALVGIGASELGALLPALRYRFPRLAGPTPVDTEPARNKYRFDAAKRLLAAAAAHSSGLVLIVEDLHWADPATLKLLRFLVDRPPAATLLVGTYRSTEVQSTDPLPSILTAGRPSISRQTLHALTVEDIVKLLPEDDDDREDVAERLLGDTGGNPLLVALEIDSAAAPAEGFENAIQAHLARLPAETLDALAVASVIGRMFTLRTLRRMLDGPATRLAADLDHACPRLLNNGDDAYEFRHDLIRKALYASLSDGRRASLHESVGGILLDDARAGEEQLSLDAARHLLRAGVMVEPGRKAEAALLAAAHADRMASYEESAEMYEAAAGQLGRCRPVDDTRSARALIDLGRALMQLGDEDASKDAYSRAIEVAIRADLATERVEGALGFGGTVKFTGETNRQLVEQLKAAQGLAEGRPVPPRILARLHGRLALEEFFAGTSKRSEERAGGVSGDVQRARREGDPEVLAWALLGELFVRWMPEEPIARRVELAEEMLVAATEAGNVELQSWAHGWRMVHLMEAGDSAGVDHDLAQMEYNARHVLGFAYARWCPAAIRTGRSLVMNDIREAESEIVRALSLWPRPTALMYSGVQLAILRREQGRYGEVEDQLTDVVGSDPPNPFYQAALALLYAESGRDARAAGLLDSLLGTGLTEIRANGLWLAAVAVAAETAVALDDGASARVLYDMLLPHAGRNVVVALAVTCLGSTDRYLAGLAACLGDPAAAEQHFADARRLDGQSDSILWRIHGDIGRLALRLRLGGQTDPVRHEATELRREAEALGLQRAAGRLDQILAGEG